MLKIFNLFKSFDGKILFDGFTYSFENGIYIISGASGVGKTTLLRMIAGLDQDFTGTIDGGGYQNVSMSFQEYRLFPELNALENLLVILDTASDAKKERAISLLSSLGFSEEDMQLYPSQMSGGMKLRVSIARAILKDSVVLLLDEPTRELNKELTKAVSRLLIKEAEHRVVIIVSHDDIYGLFPHHISIVIGK